MTFVDWAQIISAFGTTTAAGIAAFTAFLSLKQLRYQFSPHLFVATEAFQIKICSSSLEGFFWEKPSDEARYLNGGRDDYHFRLMNVGSGAAHDVRVAAEFDLEGTYEDLLSKLAPHAPDLEIVQEDWGAKVTVRGQHVGGFKNPDQARAVVDYIRPVREERVEVPIIIDPTLAYFAVMYGHYLMCESIDGKTAPPAQIINIDFSIRYVDAGGVDRVKRDQHRLVITPGRWKSDKSDGMCFVNLVKRT